LKGRSIAQSLRNMLVVYALLILVYVFLKTFNPLSLLPITILATLIAIPKLRMFISTVVYASMFYLVSSLPEGIYLSMPLSISTPVILMSRKTVDAGEHGVLGFSTRLIFTYLSLSIPVALVSPQTLTVLAVAFTSTTLVAAYTYTRLGLAKIAVLNIQKEAILGDKAVVAIEIEVPINAVAILRHRFESMTCSINRKRVVELSLPAEHVGVQRVDVSILMCDANGFACRDMGYITIEYSVVPLTRKALEEVQKVFQQIEEAEALLKAVEVSVAELSGVGEIAKGVEAAKILYNHVGKALRGEFIARIYEKLARIAIESEYSGESITKSRVGEYAGVRPYTPGDSLKHIHWKKSVSRGSLVVKEFTTGSIAETQSVGSRGAEPIIVADFFASNDVELDRIVFNLLKLCLQITHLNSESRVVVALVLGDVLAVVKGRAIEVLYSLYKIFREEIYRLQTIYSYNPSKLDWEKALEIVKLGAEYKPTSLIIYSNNIFAEKILEILLKNSLYPPKTIATISSKSLTLRYAVTLNTLYRYGYTYLNPETIQGI